MATLTLAGYDAEHFTDPDAFRPQRWLAVDRPFAYASTPFGGGVHRCVGAALAGLEIRVVLHELARTAASLAPAPGRPGRPVSFSAVFVPSRGGRIVAGPILNAARADASARASRTPVSLAS